MLPLLTQPEGKTLEFKRDTSSPKNWKERKQWGSGIPGIFQQVREKKLPEPSIEEIAGRLRFTTNSRLQKYRLTPKGQQLLEDRK